MRDTLLISVLVLLSIFVQAQSGVIKGVVLDQLTNQPIEFASVIISGESVGTTTDLEGRYTITNLEPGLYALEASFLGYETQKFSEIQVYNNKPAEINFNLSETSENLTEVVVKASPFLKKEDAPVSLRTIGVAEIQRNPGGNRDISKVMQTMPGVTSSSSFRNDLIIRGGSPSENRFYLDDIEVPNINHFATQGASGGPVGMINVNFIKEVEFYSSAFPADRGNALSSVMSFRQRDGRSDRVGGSVLVGASDAGLTLEGPIGNKTTFLISARRSYLQFLFSLLDLPFLPTYNDFQVKVKYKPSQKSEITFLGLGAIDEFALNYDAKPSEENLFTLDNIPKNTQWNYATGVVYKYFTKQGYWTTVLSRNMLNNKAIKYFNNDESSSDNLILDYSSQEIENKLRLENTTRWNDYKFTGGIGTEYVKYNNTTFNKIFTASGAQAFNFTSAIEFFKYYAFGQISRKFLNDGLTLSFGLRMDGTSYSQEVNNPLDQLSPRASVSYNISPTFSINANVGRYYQLPSYTLLGFRDNAQELVNKDRLAWIRADHAVLGIEWEVSEASRLTVEGYVKSYASYPFLLLDSLTLANLGGDFGVIGNSPAESRSKGQTYGMEVMFQQRLFKGFYGIGAYTLGWSEFEDKQRKLVPSAWDARHILSVTAGKQFKKNWEVGLSWRFQTGLPYSPFSDQSSLVLNWDRNGSGIPNYNLLNTQRGQLSSTIDMRIDKKWYFKKWSLNIYLDLENITGNAVGNPQLILDRPLDSDGYPIGSGIIENPNAPEDQQRYKLKTIDDATGSLIPSIGVMIEI